MLTALSVLFVFTGEQRVLTGPRLHRAEPPPIADASLSTGVVFYAQYSIVCVVAASDHLFISV